MFNSLLIVGVVVSNIAIIGLVGTRRAVETRSK